MMTDQINKLAASIKPVDLPFHHYPEKLRRIGAKLAPKIGRPATAFVFDSAASTIRGWEEEMEMQQKA